MLSDDIWTWINLAKKLVIKMVNIFNIDNFLGNCFVQFACLKQPYRGNPARYNRPGNPIFVRGFNIRKKAGQWPLETGRERGEVKLCSSKDIKKWLLVTFWNFRKRKNNKIPIKWKKGTKGYCWIHFNEGVWENVWDNLDIYRDW